MAKLLPLVSKVCRMKVPSTLLKPPKGFKTPDIHAFEEDVERLGEDIAEEFKETIIDNIENNAYGFQLAEGTIRQKGSDTPLIDTHALVDAIYRDGTSVSVENSERADSSLTNLELAIVHEYGTKEKHIPPRPVWRNTFEEFRDTAKERVEEFLDTHKFPRHE